MASLTARISLLAQAIRDQFNTIKPQLIPSGGAPNAMLVKSTAADYSVKWSAQAYRFGFFCDGKPTATETFGPHVASDAFTLPNGLTQSIAKAVVAFTASAVWTLKRNGTAIGTVTFAAGSATGVVATSTSADVAVARGDLLTLVPPATVDSSGAGIGFTFVGTQ